jgi:SAM-dependent methyltransferase
MFPIAFPDLLAPSRWRFAPADAQLDYYRRTAASYDEVHVGEGDAHTESLGYIAGFLRQIGAQSVLDVGCGTGRGIRYLREHVPGVRAEGCDPSGDLLRIARENHAIPDDRLHHGDMASLPFAPGSFDAVMSLGVLHHVPNPDDVVRRMVELAAKAVFISDSNYMAQGSIAARLLKFALTRARVWPLTKYVAQGFKGWAYSEGDGIFYSYSVFNDLPLVEQEFARVLVIPVGCDTDAGRRCPVLRAPTALVAGLR